MLPLSRPSVAGLRKVDPTNFDSDDHLQTAIGSAPTPPHGSRIHFLSAAVTKARRAQCGFLFGAHTLLPALRALHHDSYSTSRSPLAGRCWRS